MDVILLERIAKLGQMGDVVKVKPGYARNYLLPQKKAVRATEESRKRFEAQRAQLEATNLERRAEAEKIAAGMSGLSVILIRQAGDSGQLYGSVTARDVAEAISEAGVTVSRQQIDLSRPIKALGLHVLPVNLHPEVAVEVTVNVARSRDEAEIQAQSGRVVAGEIAEEGAAPIEIEEQARTLFEEEVVEQALEELEEIASEEASEHPGHGRTEKPGKPLSSEQE